MKLCILDTFHNESCRRALLAAEACESSDGEVEPCSEYITAFSMLFPTIGPDINFD
jgi:hypothetical protein